MGSDGSICSRQVSSVSSRSSLEAESIQPVQQKEIQMEG